ncbi:hypothetical protein LTR70_007330 [Exophiala xenobiotica]|uniref:Uncharacterized protein n=1 Tax=Lithohypha guttulata TaxID=1690604 RepID=A0ABR0K4H8_9EURO|nr:hypothetical protein LTR24_007100 [Lithohypha guttulata]KAK5314119.1 hypothetical protein LTR70_007330 [Exophiala xenobiotica]
MGTRHLILVWYKCKWHLAQYGQNDGFPKGQGIRIVRFLTNTGDGTGPDTTNTGPSNESKELTASASSRDNVAEQMKEFRADAELIAKEAWKVRNSAGRRGMTADEYLEYEKKHQLDVGCHQPWMLVQPSLARDCGAQILSVVAHAKDKIPIELATDFLVSNSCEWAYVIDLDDQVFEVYRGATDREPDNTERFDREDFMQGAEHCPKLLVKYPFTDLEGMTKERLKSEVYDAWDEWEYGSDLELRNLMRESKLIL